MKSLWSDSGKTFPAFFYQNFAQGPRYMQLKVYLAVFEFPANLAILAHSCGKSDDQLGL